MKRLACLSIALVLAAASAWGADYDRTEKSPLYEARLRVPASAIAIAPLKDRILSLYKKNVAEVKDEAKEDQEGNKNFHPYLLDTRWRTTFENAAVLSLSAEIYADTGGAHPNSAFETLVWDKRHDRAVPIEALFAPGRTKAATSAIAKAAQDAWTKTYIQRSGQRPGPDTDMADVGIGPDPAKLASYALTHAAGQAKANGIVILYGAGQAWPHVLGDFRLGIPARVFVSDLAPEWAGVFAADAP
jgi:hypothetical protein